MRIAIGCPIFEREWCFDKWANSVEAQRWHPEEVEMHFVYSPGRDGTLDAINRRFPDAKVTTVEGPGFTNDERGDVSRYTRLSELRNFLLDSVRESGPDYFLSWDSDMIFGPVLHRLFIGRPVAGALLEMLGQDWMFDAHVEAAHASFMELTEDGENAVRIQGFNVNGPPFQVRVVMGTVMMRPEAYMNVNYEPHPQGEDIGFALACRRAGIEQWIVPTARGVHLHEGPE